MKNKLFVVSALCAATLFSAQIDLRNTRFGITGGGTYSRVSNAHNPSGPIYSGFGGVLALIPVDNNDQFYIQPGIEYLGAGETGKDKDLKGTVGYDAVYANNYISVPLYFKGYFSEAESEFFGLAGPKFNFLINQNIKNAPLRYTEEGDPATGINGKAASFNFGVGVGIGFSYKRMFEVSGRYEIGLTNTYKAQMKEQTNDPNVSKKKSEQVLSVGLSYIFQ